MSTNEIIFQILGFDFTENQPREFIAYNVTQHGPSQYELHRQYLLDAEPLGKPYKLGSPHLSLESCISKALVDLRDIEIKADLYPELRDEKNLKIYHDKAEEIVKIRAFNFPKVISVYGNRAKYPASADAKRFEAYREFLYRAFGKIELNNLTEISFQSLVQEEIDSLKKTLDGNE